MPPRHSFWVILVGKTATSFRGKEREELVPTLRQLQRTQSDVTLRWFERGKVWESPQAAIAAAKLAGTIAREKRTREWRPGGEHRDPKARFELTRDQKRAKFKRDRTAGGHSDRAPGDGRKRSPFAERPAGDRPPRPPRDQRFGDRPRGDRPFGDRPPRREGRDRDQRRERPASPPMQNPFKTSSGSNSRPPTPFKSPTPFKPRSPGGRPSGPRRSGDRGGFRPPKRRS